MELLRYRKPWQRLYIFPFPPTRAGIVKAVVSQALAGRADLTFLQDEVGRYCRYWVCLYLDFLLLPFPWHMIFLIVPLKRRCELLTLCIPVKWPNDDVHQNEVHNVQYFLWMFAFLVAWFLLLLRSFTGNLRSCISLPGSIYTKQISKLCTYLKKMKFKALSQQWSPSRETSCMDPEHKKTPGEGHCLVRICSHPASTMSWLQTLTNTVILRGKKKQLKKHVMISSWVFQLDLLLRSFWEG